MSSKIFKSIWIVAFAVFITSMFFIMSVSYTYILETSKSQLKLETELYAKGVEHSGAFFFHELQIEDQRVTWVSADGTVLYDSVADKNTMDNHMDREEIREALETGYGESVRESDTVSGNYIYSAEQLSDGTVIRISITKISVSALFKSFAASIVVVIIFAIIASVFLASRLAKKIVEPINNIDPDKSNEYLGMKIYAEVEPLLHRIVKQQDQLKADRDEIEKASLIRQEFTANVSHELKTPLHSISGYAELIENGMVYDEDIKPFASKIRNESKRMTHLVEDIIVLTKLDGGAIKMKWEDCDFCRIVEMAVDSLSAASSENKVEIIKKLEPVNVYGIQQHLYSIVYNLCENAMKYNREGGSVTVKVKKRCDGVLLSVKDTGIGIPNESRDRIFERFYRVDKSRSKAVGGTGLGLSIVKHAVLIHGGSLMVNSIPGIGSEFTVLFPAKEA